MYVTNALSHSSTVIPEDSKMNLPTSQSHSKKYICEICGFSCAKYSNFL